MVFWHIAWSVITVAVYTADKSRASRNNGNRVAENALLALGFVGGWPGALLAQQVFRHKTRKVSFQVKFWCSVIASMALEWAALNAL